MTEDRRNAADESPEISNIFAETPAPRPRDRSGAEDAVAPDPSSRPLPTPAATPERTGAPSPELRRAPAADPSADAAAEAAGKAVLSRRRPPPPGGMPGGLPNRPLPPTAEAAKAGPPPATTANGAPANANDGDIPFQSCTYRIFRSFWYFYFHLWLLRESVQIGCNM